MYMYRGGNPKAYITGKINVTANSKSNAAFNLFGMSIVYGFAFLARGLLIK